MKKIVLLCIAVLCFTGCNQKKEQQLVCSKTESSDGVELKQEYTITTVKDKVSEVKLSNTYEFKEKTSYENFEQMAKFNQNSYQAYEKDQVEYSYNKGKKNYTDTLIVHYNKLTDKQLETLGLERSQADLQQRIENQGFRCKK